MGELFISPAYQVQRVENSAGHPVYQRGTGIGGGRS